MCGFYLKDIVLGHYVRQDRLGCAAITNDPEIYLTYYFSLIIAWLKF